MIRIAPGVTIPEHELEFAPIRAQGAGGQNVNKVESAVHLRFDIQASSLPDACKQRLLGTGDRRISRAGIIVIKAQTFRSQDRNRTDARRRLIEMIRAALVIRRRRIATRPGPGARQRRLDAKAVRGRIKSARSYRPRLDDD